VFVDAVSDKELLAFEARLPTLGLRKSTPPPESLGKAGGQAARKASSRPSHSKVSLFTSHSSVIVSVWRQSRGYLTFHRPIVQFRCWFAHDHVFCRVFRLLVAVAACSKTGSGWRQQERSEQCVSWAQRVTRPGADCNALHFAAGCIPFNCRAVAKAGRVAEQRSQQGGCTRVA
jgi:hypothetical protein